jgi:hypothetical protein
MEVAWFYIIESCCRPDGVDLIFYIVKATDSKRSLGDDGDEEIIFKSTPQYS